MATKKAIKPKVYSLCSCGYDLMYKCGSCNRVFNIVDSKFRFCPTCGKPIDWGVVYTVNEEWKNEYCRALDVDKKKQHAMERFIDDLNLRITDGEKKQLRQTQATKNAILVSNINYYLGNGWTREQLINQRFYTEKDFEIFDEVLENARKRL